MVNVDVTVVYTINFIQYSLLFTRSYM